MPMPNGVAKEFGIDANQWRTLVDQIFPTAKSTGAIELALSYCKSRKLDIFKKPVHIVPMYSSVLKREVETVWPSIAEIRTTAARTGEYAGIDEIQYGPERHEDFTFDKWVDKKQVSVTETVTYPEWASVVVYRIVKGQRQPFHAKVRWKEAYARMGKSDTPNEMWRKRTFGQIDKCVEAAALRMAFPEETGSMYAAEEMEGQIAPAPASVETQAKAAASRAEAPDPDADETAEALREAGKDVEDADVVDEDAPDPDAGETVDQETGEVKEVDKEVADAEFNEIEDYFANLMDGLDAAEDEASVEEVYTNADPMARFEGQQMLQVRAQNLKSRRLIHLKKKKK